MYLAGTWVRPGRLPVTRSGLGCLDVSALPGPDKSRAVLSPHVTPFPTRWLAPGNGLCKGRRGDERLEAARYRRLLARARTLAFEPEELDEAIGQEPRLLDVVLTSRHAT